MRRVMLLLAVTGVLTGVVALAAHAGGPPTGWGGENPFNCVLQNAGYEATGPDPAADPYCIEFDKRRQNVTEGGVVEFLALEPARVGAASPKCFYFQSDHWRGSIVQEDGSTKTYEWDGHYFFDKATGDGGVWVTNFNFNGQTYDLSQIPGMPPEYGQHFGPGTGGVRSTNAVEADPNCVARAKAEHDKIYARRASSAGPNGGPRGCVAAGGTASGRHLGPVKLGDRDGAIRARLGDPGAVRRGFLRYCATGGGVLLVGQRGDRSGENGADPDAAAIFLWSDNRGVRAGKVRPGVRTRVLRRAFPRRRSIGKVGRTRVMRLRPRSGLLAGVRQGRVRWLAVHDRSKVRSRGAVRGALRRAIVR